MEVGADVAAAAAVAAAHALHAVLVEDAVGGDAGAAGDVVAAHLRERALEVDLGAVELGRPLEDAVGHRVEVLDRARAAEQHVDLVVIGLHLGVADRPVHVVAVAARRVELERPVAQGAAAPEVGTAAEHARAHPRVRRAGGRVLLLVHDPVARKGVARVRGELLGIAVRRVRAVGALEVVLGHVDRALAGR
jgi:hypothetical protein